MRPVRGTLRRARAAATRAARVARFWRDYATFARLHARARPELRLDRRDVWMQLDDATGEMTYDRHYVLHPAWAARVLAGTRPRVHVDISSSLAFVGVLSAFVPVRHYDFRRPDIALDGLEVGAVDLARLPFDDASVPSLSCMHVLEHLGLGRYGDPLDPTLDQRAMRELARVVGPGGDLLVVVPVGAPRVVFNAHRVYRAAEVEAALAPLDLVEYRLIPDRAADGHLVLDPGFTRSDAQGYGCGCFHFRRPS